MDVSALPTLNAVLNLAAAVLLATGYVMIRTRRIAAHRASMLAAFVTSAAFLTAYLVYHANAGSRPFPGRGAVRLAYLAVLVSHSVLAAAVVPLALVTLARALRGRYDRHAAVAKWTLPIWLYVSVTGVVVYWMLYRWRP
jgi:putative membrane protein